MKSAISCVLLGSLDGTNEFDKKYTWRVGHRNIHKPVYPLVLVPYQDFFWDAIMESIKVKEAVLLEVCKDAETSNDTRGRLFELIVICRCIAGNLTLTQSSTLSGFPGLEQCNLVERFPSDKLPKLSQDGLYVPVNTNFPAIDLVWKLPGNKIWCVQVHVSTHPNVLADLEIKWVAR